MNMRKIQTLLTKLGFDPKGIDGRRGPNTIKAIKSFQKHAELQVDGVAGPMTQAALKEAAAPIGKHKAEPNKAAIENSEALPADKGRKAVRMSKAKTVVIGRTSRTIKELIIHCTATPEGRDVTMKDVGSWHKQRGWNRPGYHYLVRLNGKIEIGCPIGQRGIHTRGHNTGTVSISYAGGCTKDMKKAKDTRTPAQKASMLWLAKALCNDYPINKISGHNQYASKACPSFKVQKDALGNIKGFKNGKRV